MAPRSLPEASPKPPPNRPPIKHGPNLGWGGGPKVPFLIKNRFLKNISYNFGAKNEPFLRYLLEGLFSGPGGLLEGHFLGLFLRPKSIRPPGALLEDVSSENLLLAPLRI